MTKLTAYGFVVVTIVFTVLGQLLIKSQAMHAGSLPAGWADRLGFFLNLLFSFRVMAGLLSAVIAAFAWMLAMTKLPINVAYPMMSLTYPLVFILGWFLFGEAISQWRVMGICLILLGIFFICLE